MKAGESAWLVEKREDGRSTGYLTLFGQTRAGLPALGWTTHIEHALKFADRESAHLAAAAMSSETMVCDHSWC